MPDSENGDATGSDDVVEMMDAFNLPGDRAAEAGNGGAAVAAMRRVFNRCEGVRRSSGIRIESVTIFTAEGPNFACAPAPRLVACCTRAFALPGHDQARAQSRFLTSNF